MRTSVKADALTFYRREATGPGPLWASAARSIVSILERYPPCRAVPMLDRIAESCKGMAVSCYFTGAANMVRTAQRNAKRRIG